jgi:hypothetical protein
MSVPHPKLLSSYPQHVRECRACIRPGALDQRL